MYCLGLIVLSAGIVQCGSKKSKSSPVQVNIIPDTPIVITASIEGQEGKEAPWFKFRVSVDNLTDQAFELVALQLEITGQGSSGQLTTAEAAFDPSSFNVVVLDTQCEYKTFGTWAPNTKREIGVIGYPITGGLTCPSLTAEFVVGGNPKGGPSGKNFRYRVKAIPLGYFVDANGDPEDRFEKFKYFFTK